MSGSSDAVRAQAAKFVQRYRREGKVEFTLSVRELKAVLERDGFPPGNTPQVCSALRSRRFLEAENLELIRADGPPSMQSTTVVFHYRSRGTESNPTRPPVVDPRIEAFHRAAGSLRDVFAEFGGGEKFLEWVRSDMDRQL